MKNSLRAALRLVIIFPLWLLDRISSAYSLLMTAGRASGTDLWLELQSDRIRRKKTQVEHASGGKTLGLTFYTPNSLCQLRADTFSTKEPETLAWIDRYGGNGTLFDVGANVGLYSISYARTQPGTVYAFEPSVFNLGLLAKNINANGVQKKVKIVANPLSDVTGFAEFSMQSTEEGAALSAFGVEYGHDGEPIHKVFSYRTCGFSMDDLVGAGTIPDQPGLIKIDVDGIEHLVLRGARKTISHPACRTILIEVNDEFDELSREVRDILTAANFFLEEEAHSAVFEQSHTSNTIFNQIWVKRGA